MKKFIILAVMAVLSMLGCIGLTSCHYCDTSSTDESWFTSEDSVVIATIAQHAVANPTFSSPEDVLNYISLLHERSETECILQTLHPKVIGTICNVLEQNKKPLTFNNIRSEYYDSKPLYDSMSKSEEQFALRSKNECNIAETDTIVEYRKYTSPPITPLTVKKGGSGNE